VDDNGSVLLHGRQRWVVLGVILTGTFMNVFDFFTVNVATPSLHHDLGSGPAALELIVGGYGLTYSLGLVTGGRLGDRYGRRRLFFGGMVVFALASAASGTAPTSAALVAARLLQGASASIMMPQVLSIIRVSFATEERRAALAVLGTTIALGQVSGQALGGIILSANIFGLSWRPIFLVNVPVAALAMLLGFRRVPESTSPTRPSLDLPGVFLLTATATLLVLPLVAGRTLHWPLWTWCCLAAVPGGTWALIAWEQRAGRDRQPLVDLGLFRSRDFTVGLLINVSLFATMTSFFFVLGLYLQEGRGDGPLTAGLSFVPLAVGNFTASVCTSRLVARYGRDVLSAGAVLQVVGLIMLVADTTWPSTLGSLLLPAIFVFGLGQGLLVPSIIGVVLARIRSEDSGAAGGVLVMVQQLFGTIGLVVVSICFFAFTGAGHLLGYTRAFRAAVVCDIGLATATLVCSRFLAGRDATRRAQDQDPAALARPATSDLDGAVVT
jgi:MFS family permease